MKHCTTIWLVFLLNAAFCLAAQAAERPSAANRAYLYQREARAVLSRHRWRISQDKQGTLEATRPDASAARTPFIKVATLTITFGPDNTTHTFCVANIVANNYERVQGGAQKFGGTLPYDNPENSKEIRVMLAEAERQLVAAHPEYSKR